MCVCVCVVTALERLKEVAPRRLEEALNATYLCSGGPRDKSFEDLRSRMSCRRRLVLWDCRLSGFSRTRLHICGASALYQATGEIEVVKRTGRWTSSAVQRYLHDSGDVLAGLSGKMARVDQHVHYT